MIKFLLKGIFRDRSRSLLPIIVVAIGVFLTVLLSTWIKGILGDMIDVSARFQTGHVKIMTRAYAENEAQLPVDLALLDVNDLTDELSGTYPDLDWVSRIRFGGLIDVAGASGETVEQGPVSGLALELLDRSKGEVERMDIEKSMVRGKIPERPGEIIISDAFAQKLGVGPGDTITFFGSTMDGAMAFTNFTISGTLRFGVAAMDKGSFIADIGDIRRTMDMADAAGELLGYFKTGGYDDIRATEIYQDFNAQYATDSDEFAPTMLRLRDQNDLDSMINYVGTLTGVFVFIFVLAMSIVLWNSGLLGGLRRYTEFGVRLALGEPKGHIYKTLIYESLLIGSIGSVVGTALGLAAALYLQEVGMDVSAMMKDNGMMIPSVYRAQITPEAFFVGFIPGVVSMVIGNALSGIGIYKRNTAALFKELEV